MNTTEFPLSVRALYAPYKEKEEDDFPVYFEKEKEKRKSLKKIQEKNKKHSTLIVHSDRDSAQKQRTMEEEAKNLNFLITGGFGHHKTWNLERRRDELAETGVRKIGNFSIVKQFRIKNRGKSKNTANLTEHCQIKSARFSERTFYSTKVAKPKRFLLDKIISRKARKVSIEMNETLDPWNSQNLQEYQTLDLQH